MNDVEENKTGWIRSAEWLETHKHLMGRSSFYDAIRRNLIPHVKVGRKILVPQDALDRMFRERSGER